MREKVDVIKRDRVTDFKAIWKAFWNPEEPEKTTEETIMSSSDFSDEDKKMLIEALKTTDKLANRMFSNSGSSRRRGSKSNIPKVKGQPTIDKQKPSVDKENEEIVDREIVD